MSEPTIIHDTAIVVAQSATAVSLTLPNSGTEVVISSGMTGPPGRDGDPGLTRFSGYGPPGVVIGAQPGDEYLDKQNGDIYTLL